MLVYDVSDSESFDNIDDWLGDKFYVNNVIEFVSRDVLHLSR